MMDITAILHMHAELSLTAVFFSDVSVRFIFYRLHNVTGYAPMACILLTIQLLANLWPEEVTLFGGMYHSTPYGVCSEKHPDHRYHTGVSASRHLAKT